MISRACSKAAFLKHLKQDTLGLNNAIKEIKNVVLQQVQTSLQLDEQVTSSKH